MPDLGIGEALTAALVSGGIDAGTAAIGASVLEGAGLGAGVGGLESAFTGGNILKGIEKGGIGGAFTGGGIGLGGDLIGGAAGDIAGGAIGGAAGSALTGGKPLTGALEGAVSGGIASQFSPTAGPPSTASSAGTGVGGPVGAGAAAPAGAVGGGDILASNPGSFDATAGNFDNFVNNLGTGATASPTVGSGTTGTPGLPNGIGSESLSSQFSAAAGGPPSLDSGSIGTLASGGGVSGSGAGTASAASSPTSLDKFFDKPGVGTAFDVVKANPGAAISAAGLGIDALESGKALEGERQLKQEAGSLASQGKQLEGFLQSGTLPPGLQQGINQASESAKATIRSQYASKGMSGSSAEQQDLAAVDQRAEAQGAQMAMQLLQTGISETGMASGLYEQLLGNAMKEDSQLGSAISNFASAASGGSQSGRGGITVNYSGNA